MKNTSKLSFKLTLCFKGFYLFLILPDEVGMLIGKFPNKFSPFDKISTLIFKKMGNILAPVISELFNMSIMEGVFPSCLKTGRVTPIFKSGKKDQSFTNDFLTFF